MSRCITPSAFTLRVFAFLYCPKMFALTATSCTVGGLGFFLGGLTALRGLACLTYGGGLSLAAAAAALLFCFRAQAAVQYLLYHIVQYLQYLQCCAALCSCFHVTALNCISLLRILGARAPSKIAAGA